MAYLAVAFVLFAIATYLAVRTRRRRPRSYPPHTFADPVDLTALTAFASVRMRRRHDLDDDRIRLILEWCVAYVRANLTPMNGGGPRDGWLMSPNMFDVVDYLRARVAEASIVIEDECLRELVGAHDDFLSRGGLSPPRGRPPSA